MGVRKAKEVGKIHRLEDDTDVFEINGLFFPRDNHAHYPEEIKTPGGPYTTIVAFKSLDEAKKFLKEKTA